MIGVRQMKLDTNYFEDTSLIYYMPPPEGREKLLYYPLSLGYFDCKPAYTLTRNVFSSFLLIVMLTGALSYETRRSKGVARAGQVLLLDCNAPHSYAAQGKCSFTFVHFAGAQSRELFDEIEQRGGSLIRASDVNMLHESIGEMLSCMKEERRISEAAASSMLYAMLMELLSSTGTAHNSGIADPVVDQAINYIQGHLTSKLTVEEIAAAVGYSPSYFSRLFASETGMSPYHFVVRSRVEQAQLLLKTTRLTVQDVAFQTGFNSAANFCYTFRRVTGASPHEFRKRPL